MSDSFCTFVYHIGRKTAANAGSYLGFSDKTRNSKDQKGYIKTEFLLLPHLNSL